MCTLYIYMYVTHILHLIHVANLCCYFQGDEPLADPNITKVRKNSMFFLYILVFLLFHLNIDSTSSSSSSSSSFSSSSFSSSTTHSPLSYIFLSLPILHCRWYHVMKRLNYCLGVIQMW